MSEDSDYSSSYYTDYRSSKSSRRRIDNQRAEKSIKTNAQASNVECKDGICYIKNRKGYSWNNFR